MLRLGLCGPLLFLAACGSSGGGAEGCRSQLQPPAAARSCELVLTDVGDGVTDVTFASNVVGEWVHEAPASGIAFHPDGDRSMGADAVVVTAADSGGFVVESASCFDDAGNALDVDFTDAPECEL
ncbi:MAG: hypothetical protein AAF411_00555 [Myxococcota bacterium]